LEDDRLNRGFHLPREHGGWMMWLAAIVAGIAHASIHGVPPLLTGMLATGMVLLYASGDWAQSANAGWRGLPFRGRSDPNSWIGPLLVLAGFILVQVPGMMVGPAWLFDLLLLPAAAAIDLRAKRQPFDTLLLGVSSFALSAPVLVFGALASPGCLRCALGFWLFPAVGFPALTLAIATQMPAPPATVRRLGWLAAAVTVVLATGWVALFRGDLAHPGG
jgi:hypothetical protein